MGFRPRRSLRLTAAGLVLLILAGATYQGVVTALERRRYRHPGRLVGIGDRQLHLYCTGEGRPTVVLEAPESGLSMSWGWVQPAVAAATRVCSYDRAGLGWSEAGTRTYDPSAVPDHLRTLLSRAGEQPPYVMVGAGLGASFARVFAGRYPDEVAALVLIDPPTAADADAAGATRAAAAPWLARLGLLRAARRLVPQDDTLPDPAEGAVHTFMNRPDHLTRAARERALSAATTAMAASVTLPARLSPAVLTTPSPDAMRTLSSQMAATATAHAILAAVDQQRAAAAPTP